VFPTGAIFCPSQAGIFLFRLDFPTVKRRDDFCGKFDNLHALLYIFKVAFDNNRRRASGLSAPDLTINI
jgi:hypothetical protein